MKKVCGDVLVLASRQHQDSQFLMEFVLEEDMQYNSLLTSSAILRHERLLLSSLCTSMAEEYLSFQAETLHENLAGEE